ncbi:hypothetical protein MHYP_G00131170, partial [Metynnis hypsauchen]
QTPPEFDPAVSPEHFVCLPGTPTPQPYLHKLLVRVNDEHESRKRVSMATLLDTMMASLGLQSSGRLNSLEHISAAAERVDGLFSTGATQEFAKMVRLMLTDRFSESFLVHSFLHQSFASEFLGEFADEAVKRLLTSCIAPRAASTAAENIPTLVMPFRACAQSFEFSRPPSEVFDDTVDLISDAILNSILDKISELSSSSIQEEPLFSSQPTDDMIFKSQDSSRGFVKSDRQNHARLATWLVLRVLRQLEPSSSDLTKEASSNDPKELTQRILRELSVSSSAAKLEDVLSGTYVELLQRFGEEGSLHKALNPQDSTFGEALMTALRKHLGADASTAVPEAEEVKSIPSKKHKGIFFHLKMPKLFQKKSRKDNVEHADQDPAGGSSNAISEKEKPKKPSVFRRMFSCFRKAVLCC